MEIALNRDYRILTYLLEHAAGRGLNGIEDRMLILDYRVMRWWFRLTRVGRAAPGSRSPLRNGDVLTRSGRQAGSATRPPKPSLSHRIAPQTDPAGPSPVGAWRATITNMGSETARQLAVDRLNAVRREIAKIIVGQDDVVEGVLICLLARGHVLLEGVPGLGKTTLLRTLARTLHLKYSRIQFTPDLMPADIVGSMIIETGERGAKSLRFQPGPIFANLVLADEINRATPKTQSALLEAMQERTVTSGTTTHELERPFLVMATQNPIEMEGTYPLPEAQLDRFLMKILVTYPDARRTEPHRGAHHPAGGSTGSNRCWIATPSWKCARYAAKCWSRRTCRNTPSNW